MTLFRCTWFDVYDQKRGVKMDEYGFVSVNRRRCLNINEPLVLVSQASQVFYVIDHSNKGWHIVQNVQQRDSFDILEKKNHDLEEKNNSLRFAASSCLLLLHYFFMVMILYSIFW